jgi:quinoprotein glucose dehydrogenase
VLETQMQALIDGKIAPEVQLELITAAETAGTPELTALLASYENTKDKANPMDTYREALYGGNIAEGINLFRYHTSAQCVRCHMVGKRGNLVGPNLTSIANVLTHQQLLESMVAPAARIAPGFGRITAIMKNGQRIEGFFESETATSMTLVAADKTHELAKADVVSTETSASGMPPMGLLLSKAEIRDLMAYLVTLDGREDEEEKH